MHSWKPPVPIDKVLSGGGLFLSLLCSTITPCVMEGLPGLSLGAVLGLVNLILILILSLVLSQPLRLPWTLSWTPLSWLSC